MIFLETTIRVEEKIFLDYSADTMTILRGLPWLARKLNGQVEPDKALEEEPGGGVPDERVLLRPDGRVPEGVLEEGRYHLQVSQGAGLVTDSSLDISLI